ncbi:MAG: hypothetical protein AAGI30_09490 [Planctomycetota bacterium]
MPANRLLSAAAIAVGVSPGAHAILIIDNGLDTNVFDSVTSDTVVVADSLGGAPTRLEVRDGAELGESIFDTSLLTDFNSSAVINGGTLTQDAFAQGNSSITLNDGLIQDDFITIDTSTGTINGGTINGDVESQGVSTIQIFDGILGEDTQAMDGSLLQIFGGEFNQDVEASESATIEIFGGTFATGGLDNQDVGVSAAGFAEVIIYGTGFQIDGEDVAFGEIAANSGVLTGTLFNGSSLETNFTRINQRIGFGVRVRGTITLVEQIIPTPGSAALLALAVFTTARRRRN